MRLGWFMAAALILALPAVGGTKIADPAGFVAGVYAKWNGSQRVADDIYSARLDALMALDTKEAGGEVGRGNDFSFWCDCQDGELKKPVVKGWDVPNAKGRKVVRASFLLDGQERVMFFYFERGKAGWKLDDVRRAGPDGWTLSVILKYGWDRDYQ